MKVRTPLEIGLVIREMRRELNLTQAELAYKIGVGRQWISAIEHGKSRVELGLVLRALQALGLAFSTDTGKRLPRSGDSISPVDIDAVIHAATNPFGQSPDNLTFGITGANSPLLPWDDSDRDDFTHSATSSAPSQLP